MSESALFPPSNLDEAVAIARYRAQSYAAASDAFTHEPDARQLEALIEAACAMDGQQGVLAAEEALFAYLRGLAGEDPAALRVRVATEYAELFVGPRAPLAPLYESIYVGSLRRLNTEVTMEVRRFYEREGLEVAKRNTVPNDHIGYELEFMATLCAREAEALEAGDATRAEALRATQLEFLSNHLGAWINAFAARVSSAYCADYYDAWVRFVQTLVSEDAAYLRQLDSLSLEAS